MDDAVVGARGWVQSWNFKILFKLGIGFSWGRGDAELTYLTNKGR
jgi:hypothetical protein